MSEPPRLLESGSEDARALLRTAVNDAPSPQARLQAMAKLGLGAPAAPAAAATAGWVKALALAAVGGMVALGGALALSRLPVPERPAPRASASPSPVRGPPAPAPLQAEAPAAQEPSAAGGPSAALEPALPPAPVMKRAAVRRVQTAREEERQEREAPPPAEELAGEEESQAHSTLAAEVALLDQVRGALSRREPARALELLEGHPQAFPDGVMTPEVRALEVEALLALGRRDEARQRAERFLREYPGSPLAPRLEARLRGP